MHIDRNSDYIYVHDHVLEQYLTTQKECEEDYQKNWKHLVEIDGVVNMDQVKRELADFSTLLKNVPVVYMELTCGRISNVMTDPSEVIAEANQQNEEHYKEYYQEEWSEKVDEIMEIFGKYRSVPDELIKQRLLSLFE